MITIIHVTNPFEHHTAKKVQGQARTIREAMAIVAPNVAEFEFPTICVVNGNPVLRKDWDKDTLKDGDVVAFTAIAGDVFTLIYLVVVVVLTAVVMSSMAKINPPKIPGQTPEPDPVFSLSGQKNQTRLTYPIEVPYGRYRLWPSYAARVYNQYVDNDQWQFQLFCIGQGEYTIEDIRIEDTPVSSFQEVEYEFYAPTELVTLFPDNVNTSVEVGNIEMYGSNEPEYPIGGGWAGGFIANSAFTQTNRLEVDVTLGNGLYYSNDAGALDTVTAEAEFEYRSVNDVGTPIGSWLPLVSFSKTLATTTPQRYTLSSDVSLGRYEVRGRRTNLKNTSSRAGNTMSWESLRAFMPSVQDYGNVTLLAVKARATNNLNNNASNRINVLATRKLPIYDAGTATWSAPTATRSIIWAFCDIFRSKYGGRLGNEFLDMDTLLALEDTFAARGDAFDWVFDQRTTIWEAARTIARAGRCAPTLNGSRVSLVRDEPRTLPVGVFTPDNILQGSFRWEIKLAAVDEHDGLEVEYTDSDTWKRETIQCLLPGEQGTNVDTMKLAGITNRYQAYREGLYLRASERHIRENVVFKTGYEGLIPTLGDLIAVSHDVPRWGQFGRVEAIDGLTLTLNRNVTFKAGETHQVVLRNKDGSGAGPYSVTAGSTGNELTLATTIVESFYIDLDHEPTYFMFGVSDMWSKLCKVTAVAPSDGEEIEITASVYNPVIFSFDELEPPALNSSTTPGVPNLPAVTGFRAITQANNLNALQLTWNAALGAQSYLIQQSNDNVSWSNVARVTTTSYLLNVVYGYLYLRVAAINTGAGPWATWSGQVGVLAVAPSNVTGLALYTPFVGTFAQVSWTPDVTAARFEVRMFTNAGATLERVTETPATVYTYDIADAIADGGANRNLRFSLLAINSAGVRSSTPVTLDVSNPFPAIQTGMSYSFLSGDATQRTYRVAWTPSTETDIAGYVVWGSATAGFTVGTPTLKYDGPATQFDISIALVTGAHPAFYWCVAAYDVWGKEYYNVCAEQTILAYP